MKENRRPAQYICGFIRTASSVWMRKCEPKEAFIPIPCSLSRAFNLVAQERQLIRRTRGRPTSSGKRFSIQRGSKVRPTGRFGDCCCWGEVKEFAEMIVSFN